MTIKIKNKKQKKMFVSKVLIAALALAGSQAVTLEDPDRLQDFCD